MPSEPVKPTSFYRSPLEAMQAPRLEEGLVPSLSRPPEESAGRAQWPP